MIISFDGLPGCNKKQIYKAIEKKLGKKVFLTRPDSKLHQEFIKNPAQNSFIYETNRLLSFTEKYQQSQTILVDSLYSLKNIYVDYLKHKEYLTDLEYSTFNRIYKQLYQEPQVIIYLFGTFENTYDRMKTNVEKDRSNKYDYSEDEFKKLHYQFEWIFDINNCQIPIYKVSVEDNIDSIVRNIEEILRKINTLF